MQLLLCHAAPTEKYKKRKHPINLSAPNLECYSTPMPNFIQTCIFSWTQLHNYKASPIQRLSESVYILQHVDGKIISTNFAFRSLKDKTTILPPPPPAQQCAKSELHPTWNGDREGHYHCGTCAEYLGEDTPTLSESTQILIPNPAWSCP